MSLETKDPRLLELLRCPGTGERTELRDGAFVCPGGERWEVVRGVPRFVGSDAYVGSFSLEWTIHTETQLDSARGDDLSASTLQEKTGLGESDVAGKLVLDAGCGTGRFTEVLSGWGASVAAIDLSLAVDTAQANVGDRDNVLVAQADIGRLPFAPESFDAIVSIGVLHHTPDTRRHFEALLPLLKPGGVVAIWVYPAAGVYATRQAWIPFTSRIPSRMYYEWCRWIVPRLRRDPSSPWSRMVARVFPYSEQEHGLDNDILDTYDGFSPRYHGCHSPEEVGAWFEAAGLEEIGCPSAFDTAVRGRKPLGVATGS